LSEDLIDRRDGKMSQKCEICGKSPQVGNSLSQRGKPKYLGGNGRKTTGIARRKFRPNLQKIRVQEGDNARARRVCTSCIRSGRVQKAVVRKPFTLPAQQ
jgi:large subunit ribosomal protein L28